MTTTLPPAGPDPAPGDTTRADTARRPARTLPWYAFGLANLAVVVVLGLGSWYLLADPEWSATGVYPQPLTAWMFWTIIAFVWAAFTFELAPFARLGQPWRGIAVAAPKLLLRSGVGPADELRALGIDVVADVPGVGRNLHDHVLLGVVYEASQPLPAGNHNLSESVLFTRSSAGTAAPDIQIALVHVPFHSPEFTAPENCYTIAPGIVYPRSRGSVTLRADGTLAIDPAYLSEPSDVDGLVEGIAMSRAIGEANAFDGWRGREVLPGPDVTDESNLRDFVARAASTYYHPAGTCAMGTGPDAVVDPELRVRGVRGLRVADASVMPTMVSVNPNATITVIGAKAAALLGGVTPVPRAHATAG